MSEKNRKRAFPGRSAFVENRYLCKQIYAPDMQTIFVIYDQIAEMLARLDPKAVLELKASQEMQQRFDSLVEKKHAGDINSREKDELDHFIVLERLMRLAKIRADESVA